MSFAKKTVRELQPYRVVPQEAWNNPKNVLKLDWNEATIPVSPKVREKLEKAIQELNLNWYPNVNNKSLTKKLSDYVGLPEENILYFASSDSAHEYIARTFLESSDDVLIVGPTYDNFRVTCQSESYNIHFHYNDGFVPDMAQLRKAILEVNPKLIYICNPNNPTGTIYTKEQIEALVKLFPETLFLVDEAYIEFSPYESSKDLVLTHSNIVICRTFSKAFGLASFRVGYILSHQHNLEFIGRIRNPKSVTSLSQVATIAALDDVQYMKNYVEIVKDAKAWFMGELDRLKIKYGTGGGGNFLLMELDYPKEYIQYLRDNNIYIRDYTHVKELNGINVRITIGTKEQMEKVIEVTEKFINHVG